ncbi:hypothetical protein CLOM_g17992 [Closterium sp. NIES-68]|nr:hypothetical protein CLOM_g17992 [Closterium sp. NIES-68]
MRKSESYHGPALRESHPLRHVSLPSRRHVSLAFLGPFHLPLLLLPLLHSLLPSSPFTSPLMVAAAACPASIPTVYANPSGSQSACCGSQDNPCGSLEAALARAADNATITLASGTYTRTTPLPPNSTTPPTTTTTTITSLPPPSAPILLPPLLSLTILGPPPPSPPAILNCNGGPCIIASCQHSSSSSSSSSNGSDGGSGSGGSWCGQQQPVLVVAHLSVVNGVTAGSGGCLLIDGYNAVLSHVSFSNCTSTGPSGGAIAVLGAATAAATATATVAATAGATATATAAATTVVATALTVSNSRAVSGGGLSEFNSSTTIANTTFTACTASQGSDFTVFPRGGGALFNASLYMHIRDSHFSRCSSSSTGGAISVQMAVAPLIVTGSVFEENEALIQGGCLELIMLPGISQILDCRFINNVVTNVPSFAAGVVAYSAAITVHNSHFEGNVASPTPAGAGSASATYLSQGAAVMVFSYMDPLIPITITDSVFKNNSAGQAGAVFLDSGKATITNCSFIENGDYENAQIGGAMVSRTITAITNCTFHGNRAAGEAGALHFMPYSPLSIANCTFTNNSVLASQGGAINIYPGVFPVHISGSRFENNTAGLSRGGAIYSESMELHVADVVFQGNQAGLQGGAVTVYGAESEGKPATATFTRCTFQGNRAALGGGAIYSGLSVRMRLTGSRIEENHSQGTGGGVLVQEFSRVTMADCDCMGNRASTGGGCLSLLANATALLSSSRLLLNRATSEGGAARVSGAATLSLLSCNVSQNAAPWGGAVWVEMGARIRAENQTVFSGNRADYMGGVVYATHVSDVTIKGSSFRGNYALHGGAIAAEAESNLTVVDSAFSENAVSAVLLQGLADATFTRCTFTQNRNPSGTGGALRLADGVVAIVQASRFEGNVAELGGGLAADGQARLDLTSGSVFTGNVAQVGAGAAFVGTAIVNVSGCAFKGNNASFSGNYAVVGGAGMYVLRSPLRADGAAGEAAGAAGAGTAGASGSGGNSGGNSGAGRQLQQQQQQQQQQGRLVVRQLSFEGNRALYLQAAAFFEATTDRQMRSRCEGCEFRGAGDTQGTMPAAFFLKWPGREEDSSMVNSRGETFVVQAAVGAHIEGLQVHVLDALNQSVAQDGTSVAAVSPDSRISGDLRGTAVNGVITIPSIGIQVTPEEAQSFEVTVTLSSPANAFPSVTRAFNISFCSSGQFLNATSLTCQDCLVGHW